MLLELCMLGCLRRRSQGTNAFLFSITGGMVGFLAGFSWKTRTLTQTLADSAMHEVRQAKDEHWLNESDRLCLTAGNSVDEDEHAARHYQAPLRWSPSFSWAFHQNSRSHNDSSTA